MKSQDYQALKQQLHCLLESEHDLIANLANTSAWLNTQLENINWVGFYLVKGDELVLGPFQGELACTRIAIGKGVCGTSAATQRVIRVSDVHQFDGHIACNVESQSEIVLPIFKQGKLVAVLDIDSPVLDRFDAIDEAGLSVLVSCIESHLDKV